MTRLSFTSQNESLVPFWFVRVKREPCSVLHQSRENPVPFCIRVGRTLFRSASEFGEPCFVLHQSRENPVPFCIRVGRTLFPSASESGEPCSVLHQSRENPVPFCIRVGRTLFPSASESGEPGNKNTTNIVSQPLLLFLPLLLSLPFDSGLLLRPLPLCF